MPNNLIATVKSLYSWLRFTCCVLIIFIGWILSSSGCSWPPPADILIGPPDPNAAYCVIKSTYGTLGEYTKYYFVQDENGTVSRTIYAAGRRSNTTIDKIGVYRDHSDGSVRFDEATLENGPGKYLDDQGYFTVRLDNIKPAGDVDKQLWFLTHSTNSGPSWSSVDFEYIPSRDYDIEYAYMAACDVKTVGFYVKELLYAAFLDGGTKVVPETDVLTPLNGRGVANGLLATEDFEVVLDTEGEIPEDGGFIRTFWEAHCSRENTGYHDNTKSTIFAVPRCTVLTALGVINTQHWLTTSEGVTWTSANAQGTACSYIFFDQIKEKEPDVQMQIKDYTRVIIHELGHQRLGDEHASDHDRHNGEGKITCVMQTGILATTTLQAIRTNPRFCQGHLQMLYNISW